MILLTILFSATCVTATILRDVSQGLVTIVAPAVVLKPQRTTADMISEQGYPVETHEARTEDGYFLTVYRIPSKGQDGSKMPVLLMHGLLCSSDVWVCLGPNNSLAYLLADAGYDVWMGMLYLGFLAAYLLADAGYDVWMGNTRGNRFSQKHETLSLDDPKFWDFSWHEQGLYDVPALVKLVLDTTGAEKLVYMGHSQGTTQFWVANAFHPQLKDQIAEMFALAPIAYMTNTKSFLFRALVTSEPVLRVGIDAVGHSECLSSDGAATTAAQLACSNALPGATLACSNALFLATGFDEEQLDPHVLPYLMEQSPAGCSFKQVLHYAQQINYGNFTMFNYGPLKNVQVYGSLLPPAYDLSRNTVNVSLFIAANDWLGQMPDVARLKQQLPNVVHDFLVPYPQFNHMDFLWAKDVRKLLNDHIMARLESLGK